jgi:hypothetical protein
MIKKLYGKFRLLFVDSQNSEASVDQHANLVKPLFWMLIVAGATSLIVFAVDFWIHPKVAASLGTFGDFFGGVLNPIFTFLTFFGLIITIVIQRMELRLAREEYEKTAIALNTQAIENTFFNTLDLHHKIVESLKFDPKIFSEGNHERMLKLAGVNLPVKPTYEGRNVFAAILLELRNNCEGMADLHSRYKFIQSEHNHILGHYFRNLYQALKAVDNYPSEMLSSLLRNSSQLVDLICDVLYAGLFSGDELHAELLGALCQLAENALLVVTLLVVVLALVGVLLALGEHGIDEACQLVGGSGDGFGLVHTRAHASEVRAERGLAGSQRRGGQAQGLGRAVGTALGLAAHHLATGDLGAWAQTHPACEVARPWESVTCLLQSR